MKPTRGSIEKMAAAVREKCNLRRPVRAKNQAKSKADTKKLLKGRPAAGRYGLLRAPSSRSEGGAFEILMERYRSRLFAVAFHITRDREGAENVVQQSFQRALLQLPRFEARSSFGEWLSDIATREAYTSRTNRTCRPRLS
jgi:hypothetical protein